MNSKGQVLLNSKSRDYLLQFGAFCVETDVIIFWAKLK